MRRWVNFASGSCKNNLNVVDDFLRHPDDAPTIGLILCKHKKALSVEYALRGTTTPIGVSQFRVTETLPDELRDSLPTPEQLTAELDSDALNGEQPLVDDVD